MLLHTYAAVLYCVNFQISKIWIHTLWSDIENKCLNVSFEASCFCAHEQPTSLSPAEDALFVQFGVFFYAYGVYLHWGYEFEYPDAHHPVLGNLLSLLSLLSVLLLFYYYY